jgi:sRNA-binding protein
MARTAAPNSIDAVVLAAMEGVVARASKVIAKAIARLAAERLEAELAAGVAAATAGRGRRGGRPARIRAVTRPRSEITRWAADRRARRVPTFVIDMTGLKTKKAIVAKYGDGVVFEKGKAAPKAK